MNNVAATIQSLMILCFKLPSTGTVINTGTGGRSAVRISLGAVEHSPNVLVVGSVHRSVVVSTLRDL